MSGNTRRREIRDGRGGPSKSNTAASDSETDRRRQNCTQIGEAGATAPSGCESSPFASTGWAAAELGTPSGREGGATSSARPAAAELEGPALQGTT